MIGIGTIGRAAESGGSTTTYQNGQYIAFITQATVGASYVRTLYISDDFGATFKTKTTPIPGSAVNHIHINYLGEIMLVYNTSLYYAASFTSNWVLIENQHTDGRCEVSWDFNTIIYIKSASGGSGTSMPLYISRNKGLSFTTLYLSGTPTTPFNITQIKMSGDGSKAYIHYAEYSWSPSDTKVCLVDLTTGSVISYNSFNIPVLRYTNYYGDYFSMRANDPNTGNSQAGILYNNSLTFLTSTSGDVYFGDNGWGVEYFNSDYTIRFFSTPSPYSTIKSYNSDYINLYGIAGDYFYYYKEISSGSGDSRYYTAYFYKLNKTVDSSPVLIKSIRLGLKTYINKQAVSRVPPPLL